MKAIRPRWPAGANKPSKKAVLIQQSIECDMSSDATGRQTWREPDGTEYEIDMILDSDMLGGDVISCSVWNGAPRVGSTTAVSGVFRTPSMPSMVQIGSGVIGGSPQTKDGPTMAEVEGGKDKVKGIDYDFSNTGIMKKSGSMDDK